MESLGGNWLLVSNSAQEKLCQFLSSKSEGQKFKFYGFLLFLLVQPKTVTGVLSCDTEESWKFWEKTDSWFPIQPKNKTKKKIVKFLGVGKRVKILNFIGWIRLKGEFLEQKIDTAVSCPSTKEPWNVWGKTDSWFPVQSKKNGEISWTRREGQNFKFYQLVLSKRQIASAKNWHSRFLSWHWRAISSHYQKLLQGLVS